jgi:hypothetical protein
MTVVRRLGEIDQTAGQGFEGQIREFIRRDFSRRRARGEAGSETDSVSNVIDRVSAASVEEIDRVVGELQEMREMLRREGERVRRELSGYAGLSQSAMASMKVIADTLAQFKPETRQPAAPAETG